MLGRESTTIIGSSRTVVAAKTMPMHGAAFPIISILCNDINHTTHTPQALVTLVS